VQNFIFFTPFSKSIFVSNGKQKPFNQLVTFKKLPFDIEKQQQFILIKEAFQTGGFF